MINMSQQNWLQALHIPLYVPRQWVNTESTPSNDDALAKIQQILKQPDVDTITQREPNVAAVVKPPKASFSVNIDIVCYVSDSLCFLDYENPRLVPLQRKLMTNILTALSVNAAPKTLNLKVSKADMHPAQKQVVTFLKAQQIGVRQLIVMGNAVYRLLVGSEGFSDNLGTHQTLQPLIQQSMGSPSDDEQPLRALVLPSTLTMLKDMHSKKIVWSALKPYLELNKQ